MGVDTDIEITEGGLELLDFLEPLWLALFDHHVNGGAAGLPSIPRSKSWPLRKAHYERLLATPGAFVLLTRRKDRAVGYVLVHIHEGADDTWPTGNRIGDIESVALLPEERSRGLGTHLLDLAEEHLAQQGIDTVQLSVMTGNDRAVEFYKRRGMVPILVTFMRLPRSVNVSDLSSSINASD
jgi:ribosomal protein S18 acetylase RimI-like enzyme